MMMGTIMARKRRSRKRGRAHQRERPQSIKPPSARFVLISWIPLVVIATLFDWLVYQDMANHHERYGHWPLPLRGIIIGIFLTVSAIAVPLFWLQLRRKDAP